MVSKIILTSLLSVAAAQTTVTVALLGMEDESSYPVSVIAAMSDATTYNIGCPYTSSCSDFPQATLIVGPSTYSLAASQSGYDVIATQKCNVISSTATCVESVGGDGAGTMTITTSTYYPTDFAVATFSVTAGADKLSATAQATAQSTARSASTSGARSSGNSASSDSMMTSMATMSSASAGNSASVAASKTSSGAAANTSNAAPANIAMIGGSLMGVAAGVMGGLIL